MVPRSPQPVQRRRVAVAQQRSRSGRQHRRHPPALPSQPVVTDGIDAAVEPQQLPARHAALQHREGDADRVELPPSDHPMLPRRELRKQPIRMLDAFRALSDLFSS